MHNKTRYPIAQHSIFQPLSRFDFALTNSPSRPLGRSLCPISVSGPVSLSAGLDLDGDLASLDLDGSDDEVDEIEENLESDTTNQAESGGNISVFEGSDSEVGGDSTGVIQGARDQLPRTSGAAQKRRKLRDLPIFASATEYDDLLRESDGEQ